MVAAVPMAGAWGQAQDGFWGGGPGAEQPPPQRGTGPSVEPGGSRCAAVPGPRAAAARVHLHEAFPLQFTLPSDEPNFSFSE